MALLIDAVIIFAYFVIILTIGLHLREGDRRID